MQGAVARANTFASHPFVNHCHKDLELLPLVLIEGQIENYQLKVHASNCTGIMPQ